MYKKIVQGSHISLIKQFGENLVLFLNDGFSYLSQRPEHPQGSTKPLEVTGSPTS